MRILIAADSFKDALPAGAVCRAIALGLRQQSSRIESIEFPLADGGEGTLEALTQQLGLQIVDIKTVDPLFRPIHAPIGLSTGGKIAVIEMAKTSGLQLLAPTERNPLRTTSLGAGQLIAAARDRGVQRVVLTIGGSATNDAGIGVAAAMGWRFLNGDGRNVHPIGSELQNIARIAPPASIAAPLQVDVLCDVVNPLFGPTGAAHVYAHQKGANDAEVAMLDAGLRHLAKLIQKHGLSDISPDTPGAGAAGGVGFGAMTFLNATLYRGIEYVLDITKFDAALAQTDLVITGEGRIDSQTLQGKVIHGICRRAAQHNIPVIALCGQLSATTSELNEIGLRAAFCINDAEPSTDGRAHTAARLSACAQQLSLSDY